MNFNKDIKYFLELLGYIFFGDLKLFPKLIVNVFCLLQALCLPFILGLALLPPCFLQGLGDCAPDLLVLNKLVLNSRAKNIDTLISREVEQNFQLVEHSAIGNGRTFVVQLST